MHEALSTTIRDLSAAEQRASWFGSKGGNREHGTSWSLLWQCAYRSVGSLLNLSPLQNRHGVDGPVPVTAPPRRKLETRDKWGGVSLFRSPCTRLLRRANVRFGSSAEVDSLRAMVR